MLSSLSQVTMMSITIFDPTTTLDIECEGQSVAHFISGRHRVAMLLEYDDFSVHCEKVESFERLSGMNCVWGPCHWTYHNELVSKTTEETSELYSILIGKARGELA